MSKPKYVRLSAIYQSARGEQITIDSPNWNPVTGEYSDLTQEEHNQVIREHLVILDERQYEMNKRMLDAYRLVRMLPLEAKMKVIDVLDILCGRQDPNNVLARWFSQDEETKLLEQARLDWHVKIEAFQEENNIETFQEAETLYKQLMEESKINGNAEIAS